MSTKPTLGYWDMRGLAQPIRNLLHLAGVEFNDKRYPFGPGTTLAERDSVSQYWFKEKFTHGLDFPNLPYWIDGEVKLTQSIAIIKYLARKYGFIANDSVTIAKQEMIEQQVFDYWKALGGMAYTYEGFETQRDNYSKTTLVQQLDSLSKYLGDSDWFTNQFSYADVLVFEFLDWSRLLSPTTFENYPNLTKFLSRFENLPMIKKYHSSEDYKSWPLFTPMAKWGYYK